MKNAIELIRVSTKAQAGEDRGGLSAQQAACSQVAKLHGLSITDRISLVDVSGAAILQTPEMLDMMSKIASRSYDGVVVKEFSRVLRPENYGDYVLFQLMADNRVTLYTATGRIEPWTPQGRMMVAFNGVMAANELETIRSRMQSGKEAKRRQGKHPGNDESLPFGVGYSNERGWHYEPEAEKIRNVFAMYLSGVPLMDICRQLGLKRHLVTYALQNEIYTGWRVYDQKTDSTVRRYKPDGRQKNSPRMPRDPAEIIRLKVLDAPLVSESDFMRVQEIMERRAKRHFRAVPRMQFTYGGFLTCSVCGDMIHVAYQREGYYVCGARIKSYRSNAHAENVDAEKIASRISSHACESKHMKRRILEENLDRLFGERLTDRGFLTEIAKESDRRNNQVHQKSRILRLQAEISSLRTKRDRVLETYYEGLLEKDARDFKIASIDQQLGLKKDMLLRETPSPSPSAAEFAKLFAPFVEFAFLSREQKRRLLSALNPDVLVANYLISGVSLPVSCDSEAGWVRPS